MYKKLGGVLGREWVGLTYPDGHGAIEGQFGLSVAPGCHRVAYDQIAVGSQQGSGQASHQHRHLQKVQHFFHKKNKIEIQKKTE